MQPYFHDLRARRGTRHSQSPVGAVFLENETLQSEKLAEQRDVRIAYMCSFNHTMSNRRGKLQRQSATAWFSTDRSKLLACNRDISLRFLHSPLYA